MRPLHLRLKGVTRYTEELDLDLRGVEPGIVAVVGANGSGKTTLIECMAPLPLWLELPSYHPTKLSESFQRHIRDGFVESTLEWGGHEYRHVVQVDPAFSAGRGKVEAFLYRDGQPVPEWPTPGRQADYLAATSALYPPRDVFLAAAFSVQTGRGNWFELERAERRDLFSQLLGQGQLQQLAERAALHRKAGDAAAADLEAEAGRLAESRAAHAEITAEIPQLEKRRDEVGAALELFTPQHQGHVDDVAAVKARVENMRAEAAKLAEQRAQLEQRRDNAETRRAAKWSELDTLLATLDAREQIEADAATLDQLQAGEASALAQRSEANVAHQRADGSCRTIKLEIEKHVARGQRLEKLATERGDRDTRRAELQPLSAELAALVVKLEGVAVADVDTEATALENATNTAAGLQHQIERAQADLGTAKRQAELLGRVPCGGRVLELNPHPADHRPAPTVDCSTCELLADAKLAQDSVAGLAENLEQLEARLVSARRAERTAREVLTTAQAALELRRADESRRDALAYVPGRLEEIERAAAAADTERAQLVSAADDEAVARTQYQVALKDRATQHELRETHDAELLRIRAEVFKLASVPARVATLATADATEPIVREAMEGAERERDQALTDLDALAAADEPALVLAEHELKAARETLATAADQLRLKRASVTIAGEDLARARGRLEQLGDVAAQLGDLEARRRQLDARRGGWVMLERALGRDGIQALEIDAAGPEVSELINELLASCFGPRFTCSLRTVRPAGDGRKQAEVFDLQIYDGERGTDARGANNYSRGEQTLISEALKLALAIFNARRSAIPIETLWRDECDGPLEPRLAVAYPAMLRKAMELGGYRWVYLISHRPDVWAQADTVINVADGGAEVST